MRITTLAIFFLLAALLTFAWAQGFRSQTITDVSVSTTQSRPSEVRSKSGSVLDNSPRKKPIR